MAPKLLEVVTDVSEESRYHWNAIPQEDVDEFTNLHARSPRAIAIRVNVVRFPSGEKRVVGMGASFAPQFSVTEKPSRR